MSQDAATATEEQLTPQERRDMLRAFADRMLRKLSTFDDPADLPALERAVRCGAAIERIYSRCDRAEKHAPDPNKLEAERADNAAEAIRARLRFTQTFDWGEERRKALGRKWTKAQKHLKSQLKAPSLASGRGGGRSRDHERGRPCGGGGSLHLEPSLGSGRGGGRSRDHEVVGGSLTSNPATTQPELPNPGASRNPTTVCAPEGASRCPDHQVMPEEDDDSTSQTANAPVANRQASTTDPGVTYIDYTDVINAARISLGLKPCTEYDDP